jgi:hypothetical protein
MHSTYFELEDALAGPEHLSRGYAWQEDIQELRPMPFLQSGAVNGAGAIISNVIDFSKWLRCLINKDQPFSEAVHNEIRRSRMVVDVEFMQDSPVYALSWFHTTLYGKKVYWHSGGTITHSALVYWFPDDNYGVTIFANSYTALEPILMYKLIEDRFQVPENQRNDIAAK